MAGLGNGTHRASVNTFATGPFSKKEAIGAMIGIRPGCRLDSYFGHYRSNPHGFALGRDESVTQTKSSQPGRMRGVPF
jgi:hypothetical protein